MRLRICTIIALLWALSHTVLLAQPTMSPLFTDNMVLQQKTEAPVWGKATPGSQITVFTSWNKASYATKTAEDGKWSVKVRTPKAGGPYSMTITKQGHEPVKISNILIGEVWLCSGQSNMQMPLEGSWGNVVNSTQEIKEAAKYPKIRLMGVNRVTSSHPEETFTAVNNGWMVCSPETVRDFSATAYFFGKEIHLKRNVPVGLIHSSWGGTPIESWMSKEALTGVTDLGNQAEMVSGWPEDREERKAKSQGAVNAWNRFADSFDETYAQFDDFKNITHDDSRWESMKIPGNLEHTYSGFNGHVLVRRTIDIPAEWEGHALTMHIEGVDDKDYTYFNGVKIGNTQGWREKRAYIIPKELVKAGKATLAIRIIDNGGRGGVCGNDQSFYLEGPDGKRLSLAGTWKSTRSADYSLMPPKPVNMYNEPHWSTVLFNAMINPLVPYSIKGAIWYQGCSNDDRAYQYRDLMRLMILDWREQWGYDFPFYITQLANFRKLQTAPGNSVWAELREAQLMADKVVPNTGMAVIIDVGDPRNDTDYQCIIL